jgi:hypothetical protein
MAIRGTDAGGLGEVYLAKAFAGRFFAEVHQDRRVALATRRAETVKEKSECTGNDIEDRGGLGGQAGEMCD